jgi:hypothetical protein
MTVHQPERKGTKVFNYKLRVLRTDLQIEDQYTRAF